MFSGLYRVVAFAILACPFSAYPQLVSFPQPRQVSTPGGLDAVADLNGDGYSDIIGFDKSGLVLLLSDGLGGYQAPSTIPIKHPVIAVIASDFNHDGIIDLLVTVEFRGRVRHCSPSRTWRRAFLRASCHSSRLIRISAHNWRFQP